ncbi:DNA processing protein [Paenibacillus sophorae]|uniref:DNA processing protein n=1 Tax=Paenibacillus sophorae TaxID=1333845 RepID=A0A1H8GE10_9BACL|nr:DNA-processing protein DprA [Paenibacillus sophorae]QWU14183.1 DNA-processing protein DprA [Paenibacillus sophorae]SEN41995.1 DNA processing protein [Paenibacillus sophorae]
MNNRDILFGLHEVEGIGWRSIDKIRKAGFLSEQAFDCTVEDWERIGITPGMSAKLSKILTPDWVKQRRLLMESAHVSMVTIFDDQYPQLLKEISQPPWVLYYRGRAELLHGPGIALVGTRVPTAYGRKVGAVLAEELAASGLAVVSGLARGIDSICHEAALGQRGGTVAVMATGMEKIYPSENRELLERISREGLVVTEYPIGTKSHPGLFPQRNRIIAGLTLGTVVVEADSRSGSLITADAALEAGRDVFAVPGPITSPKSRGALELIKQGAALVSGAADIITEYAFLLPEPADLSPDRVAGNDGIGMLCSEKNLTSDESRLYDILHQGPCSLDELLEKSGLDFGHLHSVLLSLIIKKAVTSLPGAVYKVI